MTPCPHIKLREQYLEDVKKYGVEAWKRWEYRELNGLWRDIYNEFLWMPQLEYRRKPITIRVGDRDCPEPMREAPEVGTRYYVADPSILCGYCTFTWYGELFDDLRWLADGLCHTTPEAAKAWAEAFKELARRKV